MAIKLFAEWVYPLECCLRRRRRRETRTSKSTGNIFQENVREPKRTRISCEDFSAHPIRSSAACAGAIAHGSKWSYRQTFFHCLNPVIHVLWMCKPIKTLLFMVLMHCNTPKLDITLKILLLDRNMQFFALLWYLAPLATGQIPQNMIRHEYIITTILFFIHWSKKSGQKRPQKSVTKEKSLLLGILASLATGRHQNSEVTSHLELQYTVTKVWCG